MRIREIREARKLTQSELAEKVGVSRNALSQYESGKRQPDYIILGKIADNLDVTIDYLLGRPAYEASNDDRFEGMDVDEMLDFLANSPNGRVLMSIAKNATAEDLAQIVRIVEALKG